MPGGFPIYTDTDVRGRVVDALVRAGWDVMRGVDVYPEGTPDPVHFARAVREGRVLVSNDSDMKMLAEQALARGERFPGLVWWPRQLYERLTTGELVTRFETLGAEDEAFERYPIVVFSAR